MTMQQIMIHPASLPYLIKVFAAISVLIVTWVINKLVQRSLCLIEKQRNVPIELFILIRRIIKVVIYLIGLITALEYLSAKIDTILTSLGIGGLAVGFALKDSLTNVISGITIIAYQPFSIGDYIGLKTNEKIAFSGKVIDINFRYVTIESDKNRTIVPNNTIVSSPIIVSKTAIKSGPSQSE
jgi:small conductance mechanosensitive channel